jgi:hypothetical protein
MKMFKVLFVLICLVAYMWAFSLPAKGEDVRPLNVSHSTAGTNTSLPFKAMVEKTSPVYADRQMTLKIAEVKAGQLVTVLEISGPVTSGRPFSLLVAYTDHSGSERAGWFYGTLHARVPR